MNIKIHKTNLDLVYGLIYINKRVRYNIVLADNLDLDIEEKIIKEQVEYIKTTKPKHLTQLIAYEGKLLREQH